MGGGGGGTPGMGRYKVEDAEDDGGCEDAGDVGRFRGGVRLN